MRLILIRHPAPQVAAGVCYGASDVAVAPASVDAALASLLSALPADLAPHAPVYSSPLRRCTALAAPLAATRGQPLLLDARLAEMDFGAWELRPWDDIERAGIDAWTASLLDYAPGGGETVLQVAGRVAAFLHALPRGDDAIVVCHAGTIRLLTAFHAAMRSGDQLDVATMTAAALRAASTPHRIDYGGVLVLHF
jgi:alpha-ribazole phosphatase